MTKTCWQIADNYEENKGYPIASWFRQMAMESKRLGDIKGYKLNSLHWWYWLSSLYGESWRRALIVLMGIIFVFAVLYTQSNFQVCPIEKSNVPGNEQKPCEIRTLNLSEAGRHSLATATFQNIEYRKPFTGWSELWIILEKIFAPLQAALLALAIRRKFMR